MKFANLLTGEIRESLPSGPLSVGKYVTPTPSLKDWSTVGWREVASVDDAPVGDRATQYTVEEIDGLTCRLVVAKTVNIAEEKAADDAARAEQAAQIESEQKDEARKILDGASSATDRLLKAVIEELSADNPAFVDKVLHRL